MSLNAQLTRGTKESVGYDLKSNVQITLEPFTPTCIPTGIYMSMPKGYWGKIENRSSMSLKGVQVLGGVIDPDYTGEIKVILMSIKKYHVKRGDKIAQMVFLPFTVFDDQTDNVRGDGGFGSTGV